jgi:hypothetical protein
LLPPAIKVDVPKIPIPGVPRTLRPGIELEFGFDDIISPPRKISPDPCPDPCPPPGSGGDCPDPCPDPCPDIEKLQNSEQLVAVEVVLGFDNLPRNVIQIFGTPDDLFVPRLGWITFVSGTGLKSPPVDIKYLESRIPVPARDAVEWESYDVYTVDGVFVVSATPVEELRPNLQYLYE